MMSMGLGFKQSLRQEVRLTMGQSIQIAQATLQLRFGLVEAVHGEEYKPVGECPKCHHVLAQFEIMQGFNTDPNDYSTGCPKCKARFEPRLRMATREGYAEYAFFCPSQTLAQLPALQHIPYDELRTKHAAVCNSAKVHFGGLKQAFAKAGVAYAFAPALEWRNQVLPFLGKLPDTVIAELVDATRRAIGVLRKEKGIPRYNLRQHLVNAS